MLMSDFLAYVRYNGNKWEFQVSDGYGMLLMMSTFDTREEAEAAAREDVRKRVETMSHPEDATDWERVEL